MDSQRDNEEGDRDNVQKAGHASSQEWQEYVHEDRVDVDRAGEMETHPFEEAGFA